MSDAAAPLVVPIQPVAAQALSVTLGGQDCTINLYGKHVQVPVVPTGGIATDPPVYVPIDPMFMDLYVGTGTAPILAGALCRNGVLIVRNTYLGFVGDLAFNDTQGSDDPQIPGLGTRWLLLYWPTLP
jgi:hypothetical protein